MTEAPKEFSTAYENYSVTGVVGEGGSGRVFDVRDASGNCYALKCLFPKLATTAKRKRFKNEIEFCRIERHPNLIRIIDVGVCRWDGADVPFYVMPRYSATLRTLLERRIAPSEVLRYFSQVLDGVEAAHLFGVTHRDLKPENILHDISSDRLVVADFGVAHFDEEILVTTVETKPAERLANFRYSAPEQRVKGGNVDQRADIFAVGLMLNEMFTGMVPQGSGYQSISSVAQQYAYLDALVDEMIRQSADTRIGSLDSVKKQLVARGNEYIALQKLDSARKEVVPTSAPPIVEPINIVNVDWDHERLAIYLSRTPEPKWIQRFQHPRRTSYTLGSLHHGSFQFYGDKVYVPRVVGEKAQQVVDFFKRIAVAATPEYAEDLSQEAAERERQLREELQQRTARAEQRAGVLKKLSF